MQKYVVTENEINRLRRLVGSSPAGSHVAKELYTFINSAQPLEEEEQRFDGYHNCPCCGEVHLHETEALCWDCRVAGCEPHVDEDGVNHEACRIPECGHCGVFASLMTSNEWSSNCDEGCPNHGKHWPEPRAEKVPQ